jgi:sulfonate transport system permease protein
VVFCLPLVATGPILRVLYGPGPGPQITLAALAVYYTTFIPLLVGLRAAPASWFDLMRIYGRGAWTALCAGAADGGAALSAGRVADRRACSFPGAMVGEFTGAERGMGVLALRAMRGLDVEATWAIATVAAAVSMLAYALIGRRRAPAPLPRPEVLTALPPAPFAAGRGRRGIRLVARRR